MKLTFEKKFPTHCEVNSQTGLIVCYLHCCANSNQWYSSGHTLNIPFDEEVHRQIANKLAELNKVG